MYNNKLIYSIIVYYFVYICIVCAILFMFAYLIFIIHKNI